MTDRQSVPAMETRPRILVTGGTGTLGRLVVSRLHQRAHEVRILSRKAHEERKDVEVATGDLATGEGVDAAVEGIELIVHCAGTAKGDEGLARNLVRAASRAAVRHLAFISVVGADRIPVRGGLDRAMFGYFAAKLAAERVIAESGIPWTTLRATQFYDAVLITARAMSKLPVVPVPAGVRFQPIDTAEVADRLVTLVLGAPAGMVPEMAGPHIYSMMALVQNYLRAAGKRRVLMPMWVPGGAARAVRDGANLAPDRSVGHQTWEAFLAERLATTGDPQASLA